MNFGCSIFPGCRLWIENSASFLYLSSAWIPEDINAAIAACFVFANNPFIVTRILAVSVGSCCRHPVPSFLPPPSERYLCSRHGVTFHPRSFFILLCTQIFDVAALTLWF